MKKKERIDRAMKELGVSKEPKCYCGNSLEFVTKSKDTSFGGWRKYCSRSCMSQDPSIVEKRKATMLKKYGVDSYAKVQTFNKWSDETKEKFREKSKKAFQRKYGVDHHTKTKEYIEKRKSTSLDRYGVENTFELVKNRKSFFNTEKGKDWLRSANNEGSLHLSKAREAKLLSKVNDESFAKIIISRNKDQFIEYIHQTASKISSPNRISISREIGLSTSYLNKLFRDYDMEDLYLSDYGKSNGESEVADYVRSLGFDIIQNDRKILDGKEIDILVPDKSLAIEFNGVYWHSEGSGKDRKYHLSKTDKCESLGYQLLQIYDTEWDDNVKQKIWKSIIKAKLGCIKNKIYARNCSIKKIKPSVSREFLDQNHLDGFVGAEYHFGLYHKDRLVSVISFGKSRFNRNEYEVIRFASIIDYIVVGGYSKLLKEYNREGTLVSYANRRFSSTLVKNNFFSDYDISSPNWYGYHKSDYELKHRLSFTKSKMKELIEYDDSISSFDNMLLNDYDRIWDSGNIKYINLL